MAAAAKAPYAISVGGSTGTTDVGKGPGDNFDWLHVDVNAKTGQVAVSFHTHDDDLVSSLDKIKVTDSSGATVLDAAVKLPSTDKTFPLALTYVTTTGGFKDYVIHVHNYGTSAQDVSQVVVDGKAAAGDRWDDRAPAHGTAYEEHRC